MNCGRILAILTLLIVASQVSAQGLFTPGDPVVGGRIDGDNFVVGVAGTAAGLNNWPANESPDHIIDNVGQKYLNFAEVNTGVIITPSIGSTIATAAQFWTANDAEPRDPTGYQIWGTNSPISGTTIPLSLFSPVGQGSLALPSARNSGGATVLDFNVNSEIVAFDTNSAAYTSYLLVFPNVKDGASANSMQIAEAQFYGVAVPEPATGLLGLMLCGLIPLARRRA